MTNMKWRIFVAAAAAAITSRLTTAQDDVLVPGGPIELVVQTLDADNQAQKNLVVALTDDEKSDESPTTEYWLGVQVAAVPEIAKRQLAIDHGLAVEDVSPNSPAAKADIKTLSPWRVRPENLRAGSRGTRRPKLRAHR